MPERRFKNRNFRTDYRLLFSGEQGQKVYNTMYYIVKCVFLPFPVPHPMVILWSSYGDLMV